MRSLTKDGNLDLGVTGIAETRQQLFTLYRDGDYAAAMLIRARW